MQQRWSSATRACPRLDASSIRIGVNLGDVLDRRRRIFLGDGVNIAARLEAHLRAGRRYASPGPPIDHVRGRIEAEFADLGEGRSKTSPGPCGPTRLGSPTSPARRSLTPAAPAPQKRRFGLAPLVAALAALLVVIAGGAWWLPRCEPARKRRREGARRGRAAFDRRAALRQSVGRSGAGLPRRRPDRRTDHQSRAHPRQLSSSRATRP